MSHGRQAPRERAPGVELQGERRVNASHHPVWHRHDLRLSDNHLYRDLDRCLSVYVFDPAAFARVPSCAQPEWDVTRTGPHAAQLLLAAVASLRASLRERGGELLVRCGDPASVLPQLVHLHGVDEVAWHEEPGSEEVATSLRVRSVLRRARCRTRIETGCTLYHPDDLPQPEAWASLVHPRQKMRCKRPKQRPAEERPSPGGEAREWRRRLAFQPRVMNEWRRAVRAVAAPRPVLAAPASLRLAEGDRRGRQPRGAAGAGAGRRERAPALRAAQRGHPRRGGVRRGRAAGRRCAHERAC